MFSKIFSRLGSILGKELFGRGILSSITRFAGSIFGNYLDHINDDDTEDKYKYQEEIHNKLYINTTSYGQVIPLVFGKAKLVGQVIWISNTNMINTEDIGYAKNSNKIVHHIKNNCLVSFALSICEGEIVEICRVWHNDTLIDLSLFNCKLYKGNPAQEIDPTIASYFPIGETPAFRDLAYIVFVDIDLANFHYSIPNLYFEVVRKPNVNFSSSTEDKVRAMVLIPGSGEYVYDPIVQYKFIKSFNNVVIGQEKINSHNYLGIANSVYSLNQLQITCPNVSWVAPVVCWFADSLNVADCTIIPAVEFKDDNVEYSEEWRVANFTRHNARLISRDNNDSPRYGGSINDNSVIRYLIEIRKRKLKIMFYPMIFLDLAGKPWRGHLTGEESSIPEFFQKEHGYNKFILHYASLVKNYVDSFIIGSELIGLTKIRDQNGNYPAVSELVKLASEVKKIVGDKVLVSYAADWSEYHHTAGGWYNLDDLWASQDIDFIGIDAYFPVTESLSSDINHDEIIQGWQSGEGYEYYLGNDGTKYFLDVKYAWKNIKYWWENFHYNPNGLVTRWLPKSKKIWFTEFGFPSIDKAPNKPNVFFDPSSSDSAIPKYSNGKIDFSIQRKSIRAFIDYWKQAEYIENMFLWTWDARSSPAWPFMQIWHDGHLWSTGHWVNDKFGVVSVANIILELSKRCKICHNIVNTSQLDETINGIVISKPLTGLDVINMLRVVYFFDIKTGLFNEVLFMKRARQQFKILPREDCIKLDDAQYFLLEQLSVQKIINKLNIYFIDYLNEYKLGHAYFNIEINGISNISSIRLPIMLSSPEVNQLGENILYNAQQEDKIIKFLIIDYSFRYLPGDMLIIEFLGEKYQIRIVSVLIKNYIHEIMAIVDDLTIYQNYQNSFDIKQINIPQLPSDFQYIAVELLPNIFPNIPNYKLAVYLCSKNSETLYCKTNDSNYYNLGKINNGAIFGKLISIKQNTVNICLVDEDSEMVIFCNTQLEHYNHQLLLVGKEIIKYKQIVRVDNNLYKISNLIRGICATEDMVRHEVGEEIIFLAHNPNFIDLDNIGYFKSINLCVRNKKIETKFYFSNEYFPPPYVSSFNVVGANIYLEIISRIYDSRINHYPIKLKLKIQSYCQTYNIYTEDRLIVVNSTNEELSRGLNICIISHDGINSSLPKLIEVKI